MTGWLGRLFRKVQEADVRCGAVVPAAGSSVRMGQDKLMLELDGQPVLIHTLRALDLCPYVEEIIVVTRREQIVPVAQLCKAYGLSKVVKVIAGGETRTQSVLAGVREISRHLELVAIHDGARPLVSQEVLSEVILRAAQCGAAAPAVPVKDTIKQAEDGVVTATLERDCLYAIQTPQVFEASLIKTALIRALEEHAALTDDCAAVERLGIGVALTKGSYRNLKITTPEDLAVGEALLNWRENS